MNYTEEDFVSGLDFLVRRIAELDTRMEQMSVGIQPSNETIVDQQQPVQSKIKAVQSMQRSPEVHTIQSAGGGKYTGPFAVSSAGQTGDAWSYTVKTGNVTAHILTESMMFQTSVVEVAEATSTAADGNIYLGISMDVLGLVSGSQVTLTPSFSWPSVLPDPPECKILLAEVSAGTVYQRHYGDVDIYFPGGKGMKICDEGSEVCILNFGQDISCGLMGLTIA